jgi:hypothetical protein
MAKKPTTFKSSPLPAKDEIKDLEVPRFRPFNLALRGIVGAAGTGILLNGVLRWKY